MGHIKFGTLIGVVGFLAFVEFTSGVLQGYYTPMLTNIARHLHVNDGDVNWFEGAQLMLSALVVPAFAKLGDMFGHRRILLWSTALTAAASLALPFANNFPLFVAIWALQGFYTVWLPLEIALIWSRSTGLNQPAALTAKAAGLLVAALESGAIVGALAGGQLIDTLPLQTVLIVPGLLVAICFFVIFFGVPEGTRTSAGKFDLLGLTLISIAILAFTGGLALLRVHGFQNPLVWIAIAGGILTVWPFTRHELRQQHPLIDVRLFRSRTLTPIFITTALFGMSVLGAQAPLSTFMRTDPEIHGYGIGAKGFTTSLAIGIYLLGMIAGALIYPALSRKITPRRTLTAAALLVAAGYLLFLPFHDNYTQVVTNMFIAGLGSGALIAALPAAAAAAAPRNQTGVATGLTNSIKTVGGAIASAIFGLALLHGLTDTAGTNEAGSYTGYVTVWLVCGLAALAAATLLAFVTPKNAFEDASPQK